MKDENEMMEAKMNFKTKNTEVKEIGKNGESYDYEVYCRGSLLDEDAAIEMVLAYIATGERRQEFQGVRVVVTQVIEEKIHPLAHLV